MINKMLFIVGVGRSGTSLLQCMLNAHNDISFLPETHFVRRYLHLKEDFNSISVEISNDSDLQKTGLNLSDIISQSSTVQEFYKQVLSSYGELKNKSFVGDKDPKNIEFLKTIYHYYPQAFVIHIYRDPRAVIASRKKAKWSRGRPLWKDLLAYKSQFNYGRKVGKTNTQRYFEIKYEDLIKNSKDILTDLLRLLNLEYDSGIENYYHSSSEVVIGDEISWKGKCFEPVSNEGLEKWKNELSEKEVEIIEFVLKQEMENLGYKTDDVKFKISLWFYSFFINSASFVYSFNFK